MQFDRAFVRKGKNVCNCNRTFSVPYEMPVYNTRLIVRQGKMYGTGVLKK